MQSLYSKGFEVIYDEMYQTFIDYNDEFEFYSTVLRKHHKDEVLEVGCGTGNLASYFIKNNFNYSGLDYSEDMLLLCKSKNPSATFLLGDMTNFKLPSKVNSILITGRTSSYLLTNKEINSALKSIHNNLNSEGIVCFDFIDASRFFKEIKGGVEVIHTANFNQKKYERISFFNTNSSENMMFNWSAKYYQIENNTKTVIAQDDSEVRAFTKNEWELFLHLNNFELIEFIDRKSYAFDTYVVVAKKI
ncbi:class I SAM-dependent DNA methyltransferase [Polaribacter sp.]|uniref:class I SAM-dependent DNA methyltransferase n=1 Tax=Polaribacter sp. TaxID=1920175 RepID=UPI0040485D6D